MQKVLTQALVLVVFKRVGSRAKIFQLVEAAVFGTQRLVCESVPDPRDLTTRNQQYAGNEAEASGRLDMGLWPETFKYAK